MTLKYIFVNLKRFDVPRKLGGLCPGDDPVAWIEDVIARTADLGLGRLPGTALIYMLPEGLLAAAGRALDRTPEDRRRDLAIGCQGVHWDDVSPGGNFGAFTAGRPATAVRNLGATWALVGHSEERKALQQTMAAFEPGAESDEMLSQRAARATDRLINREALAALRAGLSVLVCVGETADERGQGPLAEVATRVERVLSAQVRTGLAGVADVRDDCRVVIGYEPVWAIGPGKTPPGSDYIAYVAGLIGQVARNECGLSVPVVYGGGLKEENASTIAAIPQIGGGLVGLTQFTGQIGFDVAGLARIVAAYRSTP